MKRLALILSLLTLATAGSAYAETMVLSVPFEALGTREWGGRALQTLTIALPDSLGSEALVTASLTVRAVSTEVAANGLGELQVAAWTPQGPIVPSGRSEYLSELLEGWQPGMLVLDVTPILKDALAAQASSVEIVAGTLSSYALGRAALLPLEAGGETWAEVHLQCNVFD